ncbi:MAG: PAS domain S-box protein [Magnetococcales bacterium]|nr:PAS domain S-box protein [Magnetococcales bacterium]
MKERRRIAIMVLILAILLLLASFVTFGLFFRTGMQVQNDRLAELARIQADLLTGKSADWTTDNREGFTASRSLNDALLVKHLFAPDPRGSIELGRREGTGILFLTPPADAADETPPAWLPEEVPSAEPMRRALQGQTGVMVGIDHRDVSILAAYRPLPRLNMGLVVSLELDVVKRPFLQGMVATGSIGLFLLVVGGIALFRIGSPLVVSLQENESRISLLVESIADGLLEVDLQGRLIWCNAAAHKLLGFRQRHELLQKNIEYLLLPDEGETLRNRLGGAILESFSRGQSVNQDGVLLKRSDGQRVEVVLRLEPLFREGKRAGSVVSFSDETPRRMYQADLRRSEERLRSVVQNMPVMMGAFDAEGAILVWNRECENVTGFSAAEMVGNPLAMDRLGTFGRSMGIGPMGEGLGEDGAREVEISCRDGGTRVISWSDLTHRFPIPGWSEWGIGFDITARKEAQRRLLRVNRALRAISASGQSLLQAMDERSYLEGVCAVLRREGGYSQARITWENRLERPIGEEVDRLLSGGRGLKNDPRLTLSLRPGGLLLGELCIDAGEGFDEQEIRLLEELGNQVSLGITSLREGAERKRLAAAVDQTGDMVIIFTRDYAIAYVNPAFLNLMGIDRSSVLGMDICSLRPSVESGPGWTGLVDAMERGLHWQGRLVLETGQNGRITTDASCSPVRDPGHQLTHWVGVFRDVTRTERLEYRLRQAQKLEAIGTLAGGVAHDFNNILWVILGFTELAISQLSPDHGVVGHLKEVRQAGLRARDLIAQLLTFSRSGEAPARLIPLAPLVKETARFLSATLPASIKVVVRIETSDCMVRADPTRMHQVLMNLGTNGAQAMEEKGGLLELSMASVTLASAQAEEMGLTAGSYCCLRVEDSGPGIAPHRIDQIFDPFFTTKEAGRGTGLGLSVVHGIVQQCGGAIKAENRSQGGARFTLFLPLERVLPAEMEEKPVPAPLPRWRGHILLVDDKPTLLKMSATGLREQGCRVTPCTGVGKALERFRRHPAQFDLVIADYAMTDGNGLNLAREIHGLRPELPIFLVSGRPPEISQEALLQAGVWCILTKPLLWSELFAEIARLPKPTARSGAQVVTR